MPIRFLVLPILLTSLAQVTAPAPNTYRNTKLQFSFAYPAAFRSAGEIESSPTAITAPRPGSAVACIVTPLIAEHDVNDSVSELLTLTDLDLGCLKQPTDPGKLDTFVTKVLMDGLHENGTPTMVKGGAYNVDGHNARFRVVSVTNKPEGTTIYAGAACLIVEQHIVCWNVLAMSRARITTLLSSPITFVGHAPQALVPAASLSK